jgi:hypothetical protein
VETLSKTWIKPSRAAKSPVVMLCGQQGDEEGVCRVFMGRVSWGPILATRISVHRQMPIHRMLIIEGIVYALTDHDQLVLQWLIDRLFPSDLLAGVDHRRMVPSAELLTYFRE